MTKSRKLKTSTKPRKPQPGDADYVGYGNPPKQHRFQQGRSGNPKGRPKGSKNYSTVMRLLLQTRVPVIKDGKKRSIPMTEAVGTTLAKKALAGNFRAIQEMLDIARALEASADNAARSSSAGDKAALNVFIDRIRSGAIGVPETETEDLTAEDNSDHSTKGAAT